MISIEIPVEEANKEVLKALKCENSKILENLHFDKVKCLFLSDYNTNK